MVADLQTLDLRAELGDDARTLVPTHDGERRHRGRAGDDVVIGVAHSGRFHANLNFAGYRLTDLDLLDGPLFIEAPQDCTLGLHVTSPFHSHTRIYLCDHSHKSAKLERVLTKDFALQVRRPNDLAQPARQQRNNDPLSGTGHTGTRK